MAETKDNGVRDTQVEDKLRTLVAEASQNNPEAVWPLREFLQSHPEIWQKAGDLARIAEDAQLALVCRGSDTLLRESLALRLQAFREDLGEMTASPVEKVAIERVALCWLQSHVADIVVAQNATVDERQLGLLQKRADRAQRNFLAAVKQLCVIRKLLPKAQAKPIRPPRQAKTGQ